MADQPVMLLRRASLKAAWTFPPRVRRGFRSANAALPALKSAIGSAAGSIRGWNLSRDMFGRHRQSVRKRTPVVIRTPFSERGVLLREHRRDLSTSKFRSAREASRSGAGTALRLFLSVVTNMPPQLVASNAAVSGMAKAGGRSFPRLYTADPRAPALQHHQRARYSHRRPLSFRGTLGSMRLIHQRPYICSLHRRILRSRGNVLGLAMC